MSEVPLQVRVIHFLQPASQVVLSDGVDGLMGRASGREESVRTVQKIRLEDRFQHEQRRLLDNAQVS